MEAISVMYNFSGITYRLWGECGMIALLGVMCLVTAFLSAKPDFSKRASVIGIAALLVAFLFSLEYLSSLRNPDIQIFEGTYSDGYRDSRVAPPLPLTWGYRFFDSEGKSSTFYLDVLSKKEIFDEDFLEDDLYCVYYDAQTQIIVRIDHLGG